MKSIAGILTALALACLAGPTDASADEWQIIPEDSRLTFHGSMLGTPVIGVFEQFSADIEFDPEALAEARVTVSIDMTAINTRHNERDLALRLPEWFSAIAFPKAYFSAQGFREVGEGQYITKGNLTVRGVSRQVTLPFDLSLENGEARMTASLDLRRNDFKIGQGEWTPDAIVSYDVRVDILVTARQVPRAPAP